MRTLYYKNPRLIFIFVAVIFLAGLVYTILQPKTHKITSSQIPVNVRGLLDFRALYPPTATIDGWSLATSTTKISKQENDTVFSFVLRSSKADVTISEQAYPEILVFDNVVNGINPYDQVGTVYGKVTLGKPKNAHGAQNAVLKYGNDALIFAYPNHDLTKDDWRTVFNTLSEISR